MFNSLYLYIFLLLFTAFVLAIIPYLTRKSEQFGVTIPPTIFNRADIVQQRKRYMLIVIGVGIILTIIQVISSILFNEIVATIIFNVLIFVLLISSFLFYLPFHRKMKEMKVNEAWTASRKQTTVISTSFRDAEIVISNWYFLIPVLFTIATVIVTFFLYDKIPNKIPIHTSFSGKVTYSEKSILHMLYMPGMNLFLIGLFLFMNYMIKHSKQQINAENPEISKKQNILYRQKWSRFLFIMLLLIIFMFSFMQFTYIFPQLIPYTDMVIYAITGMMLIGTILLSFRTGQGGSRIKVEGDTDDTIMSKDEDKFWKLGQFYFNKDDPAIFIEKRFGIGWTNNWAHPMSWILLILIIGLALLLPLLFIYL